MRELAHWLKEHQFFGENSSMLVGISVLLDFTGVIETGFHNATKWEGLLEQAIEIGKMTKLSISSHQFEHVQKPDISLYPDCVIGGATAFALLAESHISVHTWPELGSIVIDIFTCGDEMNLPAVVKFFKETIPHTNLNLVQIQRGDNHE